jgi:hypothetical protein
MSKRKKKGLYPFLEVPDAKQDLLPLSGDLKDFLRNYMRQKTAEDGFVISIEEKLNDANDIVLLNPRSAAIDFAALTPNIEPIPIPQIPIAFQDSRVTFMFEKAMTNFSNKVVEALRPLKEQLTAVGNKLKTESKIIIDTWQPLLPAVKVLSANLIVQALLSEKYACLNYSTIKLVTYDYSEWINKPASNKPSSGVSDVDPLHTLLERLNEERARSIKYYNSIVV